MFVKTPNKNQTHHKTNPFSRNNTAFIQPKLKVGKPGDKYEVEADKMADQVVSKSKESSTPFIAPSTQIQKQPEEEIQQQDTIQEKPLVESISPVVQLKSLETIQSQPEEEVQTKEEEDIQPKQEEEIQQKLEEPLQLKKEHASVESLNPTIQKQPEEEVQTKEEDDIQPKQEEEVQQKLEEPLQLKKEQASVESLNPTIQKQSEEEVQTKEEEEIQEKEEEEVQTLQMQAGADAGDTSSVENNLNKGGGSPLNSNTKNEMESGFGADFGNVRVHNDSNAVQMNKDLGSQAFTNGNDIYFNEGKYNPSSNSGKHLLAHELTHTVQQGASNKSSIQKVEQSTQSTTLDKTNNTVTKPIIALDISHRFKLNDAWSTYLDNLYTEGKRIFDVDVKIGEQYHGTIKLNKKQSTATGKDAQYELSKGVHRYLDISGWSFLNPMRQEGVLPILVLDNFGDDQQTKGFLSVKMGDKAILADAKGFIKGLNSKLEQMQFLGIKPINVNGLENQFENGRLVFQVSALSTTLGGFLQVGGGIGITGNSFTVNLNADVKIAGLADGKLSIARGEDGKLSGSGDIQADIANVQATIHAEYINGLVTIQGTGKINSEKFSGEITLLVTDAAKSKQMMNAALGVETLDANKSTDKATPKTPKNQVLAGWGEVQATITPWLQGTAKVGIDNQGHITIVGDISVPNEVELMEQRGKKTDLFKVEIKAGYGIPLVGQVFLFANIGMFINAGFGPLVLKNVGFTGTYSTDPSILQKFSITGTIGINAFAIIGLEAEAGVGVTLIGHDIKAGVNVTAAAGLRAYAEATPTLEYIEKASPQGGKVGESRLKGHFEAAAQLFLQLSGALFYELDSPWWSPAPDGREEYPLGEVQYPIGDSMGIGADMDWLIGSDQTPELKFSPVEFDPNKFTADVMADPPPKKSGKSDANPQGEWKGEPGSKKDEDAKITGSGKGLPDTGKKKEDLKKLPDEKKYMRALDEMSKLEKAKPKASYGVVEAKAKKVKTKYGLDKIQLKNRKDDSIAIYVKHKKQNNAKHMLIIPLMSNAERFKLLLEAMLDFRKREASAAGESGKLSQEQANTLVTDWLKTYPIIESAKVVDGKETWDYFMDVGDKSNVEKGKLKKEQNVENSNNHENIIGVTAKINADGGHLLRIEGILSKIKLMVYSDPKTLNQLINDKRIEIQKSKGLNPEYEIQRNAIEAIVPLKKSLGLSVGKYKRAVDNAYKGGKKSDIKNAFIESFDLLKEIAKKLNIAGVKPKDWVKPDSVVRKAMDGKKAKRVIAQPLTAVQGNTAGSAATANPVGWNSIDKALRSKGEWVRAHLLSHKLHGPGDQTWNVFPGSKKMNLQYMEKQVESEAKKRIKKGEALYYNIVLTYGHSGEFDFVPSEVYMEFGEFDIVKNKRGELHKRVTFTQNIPDGSALATNDLNISSAGDLAEIAKNEGFDGMHGFFVNIVKDRNKKGAYADRISNVNNRMRIYYKEGSEVLKNHIQNLEILVENKKIQIN